MDVEITRLRRVVDSQYADIDPPNDYPDYVGTRLRAPKEPLVVLPHTLTELDRPALRRRRRRPRRRGSHASARGRAARRANRRRRSRARRGRKAAARSADRDLAGERGRPLPPRGRPASGPARPELQRRRTLRDRRRRALPLRDDQAGCVPVAQPPERMASEPHPLLVVRSSVLRAPDHADVLPRRPAVLVRSDLQLDPGREGA